MFYFPHNSKSIFSSLEDINQALIYLPAAYFATRLDEIKACRLWVQLLCLCLLLLCHSTSYWIPSLIIFCSSLSVTWKISWKCSHKIWENSTVCQVSQEFYDEMECCLENWILALFHACLFVCLIWIIVIHCKSVNCFCVLFKGLWAIRHRLL